MHTIGVVIPTLEAAPHLPLMLPPLLQSTLKPKILLIDSSSTDNTVAYARSLGIETWTIPRKEFQHGTTREMGRQKLGTSIVVMMTQDAYLTSSQSLERLVSPLIQGKAVLSYGRQLPRPEAGILEAFPRLFNYPPESHIRGLQDASIFGSYLFFNSNSCAAYLYEALEEVGGFPATPFGEDTLVAAKLLHRGYKIAYTAEATLFHSHAYSLRQEFTRHMAIGTLRKAYPSLFNLQGDQKRGKDFTRQLLLHVFSHAPHLIPYALLQTTLKWLGYRLGRMRNLHVP